MQDKAKPIHAAKESRAIVEKLLPVTTTDPAITDWTVDGVLSHARKLAADEEVLHYLGEVYLFSVLKNSTVKLQYKQ